MSEPDAESSPTADRIASLRRVFAAQSRTPEGYALTQAVVILCDLLDSSRRVEDLLQLLCDELREQRLAAPLGRK